MLDEGLVRNVDPSRPPRRGLPFWAAALIAPGVAYVLAWVVDEVVLYGRAHAFDAWYGLHGLPLPVVAVHPSFVGWLGAACAAVLIATRIARDRRIACAGLAALVVAPLGFGTLNDALAWRSAAPMTASVKLVPACAETNGGGDHIAVDGAYYRFDDTRALAIAGGWVRWSREGPSILLRVAPSDADALARHSHERIVADDRCRYDAILVDEEPSAVARVEVPLLWGTFAMTDPNESRLRAIYAALTASRR